MALSHLHAGSKILANSEHIPSPEGNYFVHFDMRYPAFLIYFQEREKPAALTKQKIIFVFYNSSRLNIFLIFLEMPKNYLNFFLSTSISESVS